MNKTIGIFPMERQTAPLARYSRDLLNCDAVCMLPQYLKSYDGKDISELDGGDFAGVPLLLSSEERVIECDTICFQDSIFIKDDDMYIELIGYARKNNKEVIIQKALSKRLGIECDESQDKISADNSSSELMEIEIPIISIFTSGAYCDQPQIELSVRKYFLDKGYKVSQIGTEDYSGLFGISPVPSFISNSDIDVQTRIVMFNHYIYDIIKNEDPDVFIIGIPDAIMRYSNSILNGMGITPFIMSNAVESDIGIVSLYYGLYEREYLKELMNYCEYRFNCKPEYFNIANTRLMDDEAIFTKEVHYLSLSSKFVISNIKFQPDITIFNSFHNDGTEQAYRRIEAELLSNIECV